MLFNRVVLTREQIANLLCAGRLSSGSVYYGPTSREFDARLTRTCLLDPSALNPIFTIAVIYTADGTLQTSQSLRTQLLVVFLSQLYSSCTFDNQQLGTSFGCNTPIDQLNF